MCASPARRARRWILLILLAALIAAVHGAGRMDPQTLEEMSLDGFDAWVKTSIGNYESDLLAAARRHSIPPRLLATVILNELGNYDLVDQGQELVFSRGSVGIAQITIPTAIDNKLVDLSEDEIEKWKERFAERHGAGALGNPAGPIPRTGLLRQAIEHLVWEKLNEPTIAIEAAARQIRLLIKRINANLDKPWPRTYLTGAIDLSHPYANIVPGQAGLADPHALQREREMQMARLIVGGYNSPKLIRTSVDLSNPGYYARARRHADNAARLIAERLVRLGWYP